MAVAAAQSSYKRMLEVVELRGPARMLDDGERVEQSIEYDVRKPLIVYYGKKGSVVQSESKSCFVVHRYQ